ncbi:phosphoribosylformylglycinamidine synthase subunit PurL [Picrophilus oshimae]|uniref:Phosphoribosylformylglycinamidine synthase subunit PurL n=1 Tax=Picrophilus torridus (strain ATCC 700027 / DSM 9790 / JCM 10055 / NBRC 100828 / KAW 2/3) TaxID=1122961 RepID=PURL_PICTO|nr:phosphoribosylformylglycinamidine synthase subunit PurL [Picrophilus oshimae]Q6KZR2.1 RecName: Full=Phosphoribosylformylglycinamidine synthase subunit PurL; Short=FGAM synthase; AltName: Full=Formylglycinamide ribonucleotide amidotransferase subunit II; Short=FGAR amidotransferase II; Short=FGAR-AT II; AltName: Full=Glutamine amidotransferase PurL; AltName: Full=Phosphoribosylformylglycinamidine synthase subunit II [Picrophilus oshimae DSM 9789]AAT43790.1 phosphoribosylformylglycinamidine synt
MDIINCSDNDLDLIGKSLALSHDEMLLIKKYFTEIKRNPSDVELQAIAQSWSEHSCYKSSKFYLKKYLSNLRNERTILAMEDDAGVVKFNDDYVYVVKMESHNHPSAVEPYGGAATGVGGIIRDVLCMGAQPVALVDSLYFGDPDNKSGFLSERFIINGVVSGIRDYGNRLGIPNVAGSIYFHEGYNTSPIVNAGCIGISRKDKIVRSRVQKARDILILCGGRTGRDGIHGVNFASRVLDLKNGENRNAVQLGNPIVEEPLIHAILELNDLGLITGMKDLGGGGLSSAVTEMLYAGNLGGTINLDSVLLKDDNMLPWEIWISESQERMLISSDERNLPQIKDVLDKWNIEFSVIGRAEEKKNLEIYYKNEKVFDLPLEFISKTPVYQRPYKKPRNRCKSEPFRDDDINKSIISLISSINVCSRAPVIRQYDHTVRGATIVRPLTGLPNNETHSDAAVIKPVDDSFAGIAVTSGSKPMLCTIDPYGGALESLIEAYKNIIVTGAEPDAIVDSLNFGNPENEETMYSFVETLKAIRDFTLKFKLQLVSGNVSFYNKNVSDIMPTPNIMMTGIIDDVRKAITTEFKNKNSLIYLIGSINGSLAGTVYSKLKDIKCYDYHNSNINDLCNVYNIIKENKEKILAAHDVSDGGIIAALIEMSFGKNIGFNVNLKDIKMNLENKLFSEHGTAIVIEVPLESEIVFNNLGIKLGYTCDDITVMDGENMVFNARISELKNLWDSGLGKYL